MSFSIVAFPMRPRIYHGIHDTMMNLFVSFHEGLEDRETLISFKLVRLKFFFSFLWSVLAILVQGWWESWDHASTQTLPK